MIRKYFNYLNPKAIYFIGFLLAYPIALIAANSIPIKLPVGTLLKLSLLVWTVLHFIKPVKKWIAGLLFVVQLSWFYSLMSQMPFYIKEGFEKIMPGGVSLAKVVYEKLFGEFYAHLVLWIRNFLVKETQAYSDLYYKIFIVFLIASIMIMVLRLIEKRVNWKFFLFTSIYFIIAWFVYVSNIRNYFSLYFVGLTVYKQFISYEELIENAKGHGEGTRFYSYSSAIVIGTLLMTSILIISTILFNFVPVESLNTQIHKVVPGITAIRSEFEPIPRPRVFNFSSTMYSPNEYLGGPIGERSYLLVMRVKGSDGAQYLRGRVKNVYDGTTWVSDFTKYYNNISINDGLIIPEEQLDEITIYPETIKTRTLFAPYKYYTSSFMRSKIYGNEDDIVYRKSKTNSSLERYTVSFVKDEYIYLYDQLAEELKEPYLEIPEEGLDQTKELTRTLIDDIQDPYEKMKLLERYLRDNYYYSLNTEEVNVDEDFVENFLFNEKKGYCTYFASSLAVMGRISGVPTRYVEGFLTSNQSDFDGFYEVTENRAHAWVEAYIEGQGWVKFEATPAYLNGDETVVEESTSDRDDDFDEESINEGPLFEPEEGPEDTVNLTSRVNTIDILLIGLYGLVLLGIIYLVYSKIRRMHDDIHLGSPSVKIDNRIHYMLSMARLVEDDVDQSKLPKYVILESARLLDVPCENVAKIIDEALYSQKEFDEDTFNQFNEFFKAYELAVRKKLSIVMYYMHKVMLNTLYHKSYYT